MVGKPNPSEDNSTNHMYTSTYILEMLVWLVGWVKIEPLTYQIVTGTKNGR